MQQQPQQVTKELQQVATKESQQVTTKNPEKVEAGKSLVEHNHRKKEAKKREELITGVNQYYSTGAVLAVGVIGGLGYHIYRTKKGEAKDVSVPCNPTVSQQLPGRAVQPLHPQSNKFEMD